MSVPYIFANIPGGSNIPLYQLDANFAYITAGTLLNPTVMGYVDIAGGLSVAGSSNFTGPVTVNDLSINGYITIGLTRIKPTGITGNGLLVFNTNPTLVSPNLISPILGTPSSGNLTNCTGYSVSNLTGTGSGVIPFLTNPTSANLANAIIDETGFGSLVFNANPVLISPNMTNPILGTPVSGNVSNCVGYNAANLTGVTSVANGGTGLAFTGAVGQILGVTAPGTVGYITNPASSGVAGGAASELLYQAAPNTTAFIPNGTVGQALISNGVSAPYWGQLDIANNAIGILPIANGGTASTTRQQAMDTLAGAVTAGQYLRGDGVNIVLAPIQASDVPTLNQNTTGSASTFTSTIQNSQFNSLGVGIAPTGVSGSVTITNYFTDSNGTLHPSLLAARQVASGTAVNFGSIPAWANKITMSFFNVKTNGSADYLIQLGSAGVYQTAGYSGSSSIPNVFGATSTSGLILTTSRAANILVSGSIIFTHLGNNIWSGIATMARPDIAYVCMSATGVQLVGVLDSIRATTTNGTDSFTGGSLNIVYE